MMAKDYLYIYINQYTFFCRYFALYEYGGIYADCDMECLQPLESYLSGRRIIIAAEPDIHTLFNYKLKSEKLVANAIMASQPRHPFFKYVIGSLVSRTKLYPSEDILHTTGPFMLQDAYEAFDSVNRDNRPTLIEAEIFLPSGDPSRKDTFKKYCDDLIGQGIRNVVRGKKICVSYLRGRGDKITEKSLTVHHWTSSWMPSFKDGINKYPKFDINDLRKPKMQFK